MKYGCDSEGLRRISVGLDPETWSMLEELVTMRKQSISQIVRNAITMLFESETKEKPQQLETWAELLSGGEHVILDVGLWAAMLDELEASNRFWKIVDEEGYRHGLFFKSIGFKHLEDILEHQQHKNWYRYRIKKNCCVLMPTSSNAMEFITRFLGKILQEMNISAKFEKSSKSLMIIEEKPV